MKIIVHDASVLIDLHHAGALDAWVAAGIEAWTTDLVFFEVEQSLEKQHALIFPRHSRWKTAPRCCLRGQ